MLVIHYFSSVIYELHAIASTKELKQKRMTWFKWSIMNPET